MLFAGNSYRKYKKKEVITGLQVPDDLVDITCGLVRRVFCSAREK